MSGFSTGFSMSVFDHTEFNTGFRNLENTKQVRDDMLQKITDEVHRSDIIARGEEFIISRSLSKGWTIEYSEPGQKFKLADTYVNTVLNRLWTPELIKVLRYGLRYGMYVVRYIATDTLAGGKVIFKPYIMNERDYIIRFRKGQDGRREYGAFYRAAAALDKPIEQSRVMVFTDCEEDGSPNSPIQKALEHIIQLREYWERNTVVDHKAAFPLNNYYVDSKEQKLIPNKIHDSAITPFEDTFGLERDAGSRTQYDALHAADLATRFMNKMLAQQVSLNENLQSYGQNERYDPIDRRFVYVAKEDPMLPFTVLPSGLRLETGAPSAVYNPGFKDTVSDLVHRISGTLGVPAEYVYDTGRRVVSDFQLTQAVVNSTTEYWQSFLEQHIITFYLDLYYHDIVNRVDDVFKAADQMLVQQSKANPSAKGATSLSSEAKRLLESSITLTVQFASNPVLQATDIQWLHDERIISKETQQMLALDLYKLSHSYRMTREEMDKEDRQEAKRQKMMEPPDKPGGSSKAKSSAKTTSAPKSGHS